MINKFKIILVSFFCVCSCYAVLHYNSDLGIRVTGVSSAKTIGASTYFRVYLIEAYPDGSSSSVLKQEGVPNGQNPGKFYYTSQNFVYVPYAVTGSTYDYHASVYINCFDDDVPDSIPDDYFFVKENNLFRNPFSYDIYIRTLYDDDILETVCIGSGESHTFDNEIYGEGLEPRHFDYQVSNNNQDWVPNSGGVSWSDFLRELSRIYGDNVWGGGGDDVSPVPPELPQIVTNYTDVTYEFQRALQNQQLSGGQIQSAFEQGLINNQLTKSGITSAFSDGLVFSGVPSELRNLSLINTDIKNMIDNLDFSVDVPPLDNSDVITAIEDIDFSVDNSDIVTAIDNLDFSVDVPPLDNSDVITAIEEKEFDNSDVITAIEDIDLLFTNNINVDVLPDLSSLEQDFEETILIDFSSLDDMFSEIDNFKNAPELDLFRERDSLMAFITSGWNIPNFTANIDKDPLIILPLAGFLNIVDSDIIIDLSKYEPVMFILRAIFLVALTFFYFIQWLKLIIWGLN
jgi:hypothetical protein